MRTCEKILFKVSVFDDCAHKDVFPPKFVVANTRDQALRSVAEASFLAVDSHSDWRVLVEVVQVQEVSLVFED